MNRDSMDEVVGKLETRDYETYVRTVVTILSSIIVILFISIVLDVRELQSCTEPVDAEYVSLNRNGNGAREYYTYEYDGKMYRYVGAKHTVNFGEDRDFGEMYTIYVNPDNPTCFKTISGDISLTVFLRFVVCIVCGFLIWYLLSSIRKPDFVVYHKEYPSGRAIMKEFDDMKHTDV